ncbi:hypothetical protein [Spartinivicinus poritis]|uniref:Uncharacterized protein n=1 Tax=Spartinivicinus poritis TaxID=2994640 RepID=A0ABT5UGH1_9GAMM|nr:hypothetical protein [Spartinivicinus sp. A2-2]MDE1465491.1 hypothetical protein [Spartinivicinus sp. A2-2]
MLVAIIGHSLMHKKSIGRYISSKQSLILMICVLCIGVSMIQTKEDLDNPFYSIFESIDNASIETMSQLTKKPLVRLIADLEVAGYSVPSANSSILEVAAANKVKPELIIATIYQSQ